MLRFFRDLSLKSKVLTPLLLVNALFVGVLVYGASQLLNVERGSNRIVEHVDPALLVSARVNQTAQRMGYLVYRILSYRTGTAEEDAAAAEFQPALASGERMLDEMIALDPDKADVVDAFKTRFDRLGIALKAQADLAATTNGFGLGTKDDPADLDKSAAIARAMVEIDKTIDNFAGDLLSFSQHVEADNAQAAAALKASSDRAVWMMIVFGLVSVCGGIGISTWLTSAAIVRPLTRLAGRMSHLAEGDLDVAIDGVGRQDEIGLMARAVQVFKDNGLRLRSSEADTTQARLALIETKAVTDAARAKAVAEQAKVVAAIADGLEHLSKGHLTYRIQSRFETDYEKLRADFNDAIGKLQHTMGGLAASAATIRSGAAEISTAADDMSRRTEQQAASLEETAAAIDQITATVEKTATGSILARTRVENAKADAERSGEIVEQAVEAMSEIDRSARKVSQIIGVIDEIAFQTNLLALNAGVEAARAGDAGRGFAVVASEVRALAQRSADAAREIKSLISASSRQVSSGVALVNETGAALKRIVLQVVDINDVVSNIATTTQDQATALQQVNTAVNQMDQATQKNAAMAEQSTAASHNLARESEVLARLIGSFELDLTVEASRPSAARSTVERRQPARADAA